jgi:hypothetical protein
VCSHHKTGLVFASLITFEEINLGREKFDRQEKQRDGKDNKRSTHISLMHLKVQHFVHDIGRVKTCRK